jgi:hypothetical protein
MTGAMQGSGLVAAHQVDLVGHNHLDCILNVAVDVNLLHPDAL